MTIESCVIRELSVNQITGHMYILRSSLLVRLWFVNRMYVVCKIQVTSPFRRPLVSSMIRTRESWPCDKKGPMSDPNTKVTQIWQEELEECRLAWLIRCIIKKSSSRYPVLYYVCPLQASIRAILPIRQGSTAEILSRTKGYMYQSYLQDFQTALRFWSNRKPSQPFDSK